MVEEGWRVGGCRGGRVEGGWLQWREGRGWVAAVEGGWRVGGCGGGGRGWMAAAEGGWRVGSCGGVKVDGGWLRWREGGWLRWREGGGGWGGEGKVEGGWLQWREGGGWVAAVEGRWRVGGCSGGKVEGGWLQWREGGGWVAAVEGRWRVGDCRWSWWRVGLRGVAIGAEWMDGHSMRNSAGKSGNSRPTSLLGSEA